ncbi:50S ribosome-binding GTPase [Candidatus Woesearchaeota archaeon]|nr:50S ribosome-binding GTPase [Candidatus Woesearchaeota archaeon]
MNFQGLSKVHTADELLDIVFRQATKEVSKLKEAFHGEPSKKMRDIDFRRIQFIERTLTGNLQGILTMFPRLDGFHDFYKELVKITLDYGQIKQSLGAVGWAIRKTQDLSGKYIALIRRCEDSKALNKYRKEYYGRISSVVKQIKKDLIYLEHARWVMRNYPTIKTGMTTVCIFGFPNVGKSTLLSKLTTAKPEIKPYAFTTKQLNIGYLQEAHRKIQIVDTPGTLNRFEKMNEVEQQAYLALRHCADAVVYVYDLTESSAPLEDQKKLYQTVKKMGKEIIVYLSKTDLLPHDRLAAFLKPGMITEISELRRLLLRKAIFT